MRQLRFGIEHYDMTPAEKRVKELIDRWLTSLDLHLGYVDLNDSAYNNVQPWPVHDRPTRWVLELAKQKAVELQAAFDSRLAMGDAKFAEVLELMNFLSTLVGIQHVQRYIPLADPDRHGQGTLTELDGLKAIGKAPPPKPQPKPISSSSTTIEATVAMPRAPVAPVAPMSKPPERLDPRPESEVTREMPRPRAPIAVPPPKKVAPPPPIPAPVKSATAAIEAASDMHTLVINDAVRLLNWGKPWHELAELVARIADRPKLPEVRRILRSHRAAIEMRVADAQEEKTDKDKKDKKEKKE